MKRSFILMLGVALVAAPTFGQLRIGGWNFQRAGNYDIGELNRWGVFRGQITGSYGTVFPPTSGSVWTNPQGDKTLNGIPFPDLPVLDPLAQFVPGGRGSQRTMTDDFFLDASGTPLDLVVLPGMSNTNATTNPTEPLSEDEKQKLLRYLRNGGAILIVGSNRSNTANNQYFLHGSLLNAFGAEDRTQGLWNPNSGFVAGNNDAAANQLVFPAGHVTAISAGPFGTVTTMFARTPGRIVGINYQSNPANAERFYDDPTRSTDVNLAGIAAPWPALPIWWRALVTTSPTVAGEPNTPIAATFEGGGYGRAVAMAYVPFDDSIVFRSATFTDAQKRSNAILMLNTVKWLTGQRSLRVTLNDFDAGLSNRTIRVELYAVGTMPPPDSAGTPLHVSYLRPLNSSSGQGDLRIILPTTLQAGRYDVRMSVVTPATQTLPEVRQQWLTASLSNISLPGFDNNLAVNFANGDTDQNNAVDDGDLTNLILDFGAAGGSTSGFRTDLNEDGTVDDGDLTILILNFGQTGS